MNKKLAKMIGRRVLQSLLTIFIVTIIIFGMMQFIPGDPIVNFLGTTATKEQIAYYTELFGYDKPVYVQYFNWITGLFRGEMGFSIQFQKEISEVLFPRLGITMSFVIIAFILSVVLGVTIGIVSALNRGKPIDTFLNFLSNIGVSMPVFWTGIVLVLIFGVKLKWLPTYGIKHLSDGFGIWLKYLILPVTVCGMSTLASFSRSTRTNMLEVINQEYVLTAKAKGVKHIKIVLKHQLRNALVPLVTVLVSRFASMIGSTVLLESIFNIPGFGNMMITAISNRDHMVVANGVLILAVFVSLANLFCDILYGILDPRIRDI